MSDKELGKALLNLDAVALAAMPDAKRQTWSILARDRGRLRILTILTVIVWLLGSALVCGGLVGFGFIFPEQAKLMTELEQGKFQPEERDSVQRTILVGFQKGTLLIALSVAALSLTAFFTVLLILASRRATLRQINASLLEVSEQLKQIRPTGPSQ